MDFIQVQNDGPLIIATDYWQSDLARAGKVFCSVHAGAIRVLLPPSAHACLADMQIAKECVLSRGPWPMQPTQEAVEILWDNGSNSPFALHLTPASFDLLPAEPEPGREWVCSTWISLDARIRLWSAFVTGGACHACRGCVRGTPEKWDNLRASW